MLQYIALGVVTFAVYKAYNIYKCPDELKSIYAAPLLSFIFFTLDMGCYREKMDRYYQSYLNKHGIIRVLTPVGWCLYVGDAKLCKEIATKADIYLRFDIFEIVPVNLRRFLGDSQVVYHNGEEWKRHRKIINPIFNKTWSTELFGTCVHDLIDELEKMAGKDVKFQHMIDRMTLDIFGKAIFDIDFNSVKNPDSKLYNLYHKIFKQLFGQPVYLLFPFLEYVPFFRRTELSHQLDEYQEFIEEMIALRKDELNNGTLDENRDLVSALVKSNENSNETKLTMEEIRDNLNIFIAGGHDTVTNTLISTLYYLARYPDIQEKLRAQVLSALGDPNPSKVQIPTIEQLKNIPLLDLVNKESMRIMTTVSAFPKKSTTISTLSNGLTIPAKTALFLHYWAVHHNPNDFPDPYEFKPERFADNSNEESRNWQPFGNGPRKCIGSTFALLEQRVTLSMLLQKFEFCISEDNPNYHKLNIVSSFLLYPNDLSLEIKIRT